VAARPETSVRRRANAAPPGVGCRLISRIIQEPGEAGPGEAR
jgi:hypothetical protein